MFLNWIFKTEKMLFLNREEEEEEEDIFFCTVNFQFHIIKFIYFAIYVLLAHLIHYQQVLSYQANLLTLNSIYG
jgi:hypothetical protein